MSSYENLSQVVFTEEELAKMDNALKALTEVLADKATRLSPDERRQYGSIAEQNKLFVNKAKKLMEQYPQYIPPFVDKAEFDRDYTSRTQLENRFTQLKRITELFSDTKVLLDHDNYTNALSFYRNIKYLNSEKIAGIETLYQELKQFFAKSNLKSEEKSE